MIKDIIYMAETDPKVCPKFWNRENIKLSDFDTESFRISPEFKIFDLDFKGHDPLRLIRSATEKVVNDFRIEGINENIYTALYEGILNAYQHGNKRNIDKNIIIAYKVGKNGAEVVIMDECSKLNPHFISFVQKQRELSDHKKPLDYYKYFNKEKNGNNGTGISFMHMYCDAVSYFRGENGGLAVCMFKSK